MKLQSAVVFLAWLQWTAAIPIQSTLVSPVHRQLDSTNNQALDVSIRKAEALTARHAGESKSEEHLLQKGMMQMQMVFYASGTMHLWFKNALVDTSGEWVASCLGLTLLATLYEGLKAWRIILANKYEVGSYMSSGHLIQTVLHLIQVTTSYFLMLAVMTYSTWVMICVCAGAAVGYFVFAKFVPAGTILGELSEHCH